MISKPNAHHLTQLITKALSSEMSVAPTAATEAQYYRACAAVVRELLAHKHGEFTAAATSRGEKKVHYLCMEFLVGRSLKNALFNLGLTDLFAQVLEEMGQVQLETLYEQEPDAGLGNGGLGRLAACYMDALATLNLPATGYCILYEFGIFRQKILSGWQTEMPDYWLPGGEVWLTPRPEQAVDIRFGGVIEEYWDRNYHHVNHHGYSTVKAVPYDMYIPGYDSRGVSVLRLWKAESLGIDMDLFNKGDYVNALGQASNAEAISKILYPNDNHAEGKQLRLRQQYFLVSASITDIVRKHMAVYGNLDRFAQFNAIHINDTHPALAIPELMRILLDECGYDWHRSWRIVTESFAYTNHTVLVEALERWNEDLMRTLLPRIYQLIYEINTRFCIDLRERHHVAEDTISSMSIIGDHEVRMANLCVVACHSVNGVSKLHSDILKQELFANYHKVTPQKFNNVTNGIASRRWLCQSNPGLTDLLTQTIGNGFAHNLTLLKKFEAYANDTTVLGRLGEIKHENKVNFSNYLSAHAGITLDPDSLFDVQVKRLHEYKRQHMNALHILTRYLYLKENPGAPFVPRTFLFGAKAAPGYYMAKQIIKLICTLRDVIDADPQVRDKLRIVYLEDYRVTLSELLMPACEISEQISLAGKEASGTGNMKLMLGGAVTLGTLDGANVEIREAVGDENIFIFGMTAQQVQERQRSGYNPESIYYQSPLLQQGMELLAHGFGGESFLDIYNNLRYQDPFMVLADFESYCSIHDRALEVYNDQNRWQRMSLHNIANSGIFCADRAVGEYARRIWGVL